MLSTKCVCAKRIKCPECLNYMNMDESGFAVKFAPFVNERNVFDIMEELAKAERHITQNVNAKMVFSIFRYA